MSKDKTSKRYRKKILTQSTEIDTLNSRLSVMNERLEKSDKEIVILQEDLADAARIVEELQDSTGIRG